MGRDIESLFDRYRSKGDLKALTRVFDRTARDLLGLAQHLVRDPHDAEDLLQTTFVTAIDRADSWDRGRPLLPWLTGILAHQAANLTRARRRRATEGLVEVEGGPSDDPSLNAETSEFQGELTLALGRIGPRYREVLEPYLCQGERPDAIALALGRAPGTVRTQIYRGLTRLRRLLPAGVGAGLLVGSLRGVPAVRSAVVRHAATAGAPLAVAATTTTTGLILGASLVSKKVIVIAAGALVTSVGLWAVVNDPLEAAFPPRARSIEIPDQATVLASVDPALMDATEAPVSEDSAPETTPARRALGRGRALVRGHLHGVREEHAPEVEFSVERTAQVVAVDVLAAGEELTYRSQRRAFETMSIAQAARGSGDASEWLRMGHVLQVDGGRYILANDGVPIDSLRREADGLFELDLTGALMETGENEEVGLAFFTVTARHEVYFEGSGECHFPPDARERLEAGEDVVVDLELALRPAAVLRGTVLRSNGWEPPVLAEVPPIDLDLNGSAKALRAQRAFAFLELQQVTTQVVTVRGLGGDSLLSFSIVMFSGIELALLRAEGEKPIDIVRVGSDGIFEFRVEEDGPFVLVAVEGDRPPVTRTVDLHLAEIVELEEDLLLEEGPRLEGLVEDFGAFPDGGIALEVERLGFAGDRPIEWAQQHLGWSRGAVVRTGAGVRTEADGVFSVSGLTPGMHRLRLADTGVATLFTSEERAESAVEVAIPASDVQLVVPLSVLEVRAQWPALSAQWPALSEQGASLRLIVEDPETGAVLARATLDGEGYGEVVARPGQHLRLRIEHEGLVFPPWEGVSPAAGKRLSVPLTGTPASAEEGEDADQRP